MRRRHCLAGALAERMRSLAPPPAAAASPGAAAILMGTASPWRSYPEAIFTPSAHASALRLMCRRTRVILSASGPFLSHGLPLVEACAKCCTDYADIMGETPFVQISMDLHSGPIKFVGVVAATAAAVAATATEDVAHGSCCLLMTF